MPLRRAARWAALCAVAVSVRLPAQPTVRPAHLHPTQDEVATRPQTRFLLRISQQALAGYGGLEKVQFRLLWDVTPPPPSRSAAVPPPCMAVPTRVVRPRVMPTGELDFGVLFDGADLRVRGAQLQEAVFYLVAEVEGQPGSNLLVSTDDLKRYVVSGVRLILQPPPGNPSPVQIQNIKSRQSKLGEITPTSGACWRVTDLPA